MRIQYFSDTDTLTIELTRKPIATTYAITDDRILDYEEEGKIVAITIDHCSKNLYSPGNSLT
jgi:uncharacterized protein YuzE